MVLTAIEEHLRTPKAESQDVPKSLHIEHIMPQAWQRHWPMPAGTDGTDAEDGIVTRDRAIHTIGNLTLVNGRLNPSLSNAAWESKRRALADHSVLFLNKRLINNGPEVWDEQVIEERARWLHAQAIKVWPHANSFIAA